MAYVCRNCGGDDLREDFEHGDIVCVDCGCCARNIICDVPTFSDVCSNGALAPAAARNALQDYTCSATGGKSAPYQRKTYFNERISQWMRTEPAIPDDDELVIITKWNKWAPRAWPDDWDRRSATTKERIGYVLEYIDNRRKSKGQKPYFKNKYLEKWISIRHCLACVRSTGELVDEEDVTWIKRQFLRVEQIFDRYIRGVGPGAGRRSFLNYNFVARRLLELRGLTFALCDWPPLKTTTKQRALVNMWRVVCLHLDWPYINSDSKVFPNEVIVT